MRSKRKFINSSFSGDTLIHLQSLGLEAIPNIIQEVESTAPWLDMTFVEKLEYVIGRVHQIKTTDRLIRMKRAAKLRIPNASISGLIYTPKRNLNRTLILELASAHFLKDVTNIAIIGHTGTGKTYLANALLNACLERDYKSLYVRFPDLIQLNEECGPDVSARRRLINRMSKYPVLVIDEWISNKVTAATQELLFEIIERRHTDYSTIVCTQFAVADGHAKLGPSASRSDSIMDRLVHNMLQIQLGDKNMRKLQNSKKSK